MSYLENLVDRAVDSEQNLENNKIGAYRITPEHVRELYVYHIYKRNAKYIPTGKRYGGEKHLFTLKIDSGINDIKIIWNKDYASGSELVSVHAALRMNYEGNRS